MDRLELPSDLSALPRARSWVRHVCASAAGWPVQGCDRGAVLDLLTTEVVSNAVRHGSGPVQLTAVVEAGRARVAVQDASPDLPVLRGPVPHEAAGGRGVALVRALATSWGVDTDASQDPSTAGTGTGGGKTVWFTVDLRS